jgi:hypothetical protein
MEFSGIQYSHVRNGVYSKMLEQFQHMIQKNLEGLIHTTEHQIIRLLSMTDNGISYGR